MCDMVDPVATCEVNAAKKSSVFCLLRRAKRQMCDMGDPVAKCKVKNVKLKKCVTWWTLLRGARQELHDEVDPVVTCKTKNRCKTA